ncbi:MAG TPA: DUF1800 domain-containing protein [Stellaceae bacterium]|nr:DUF1800 domain-containing protein [Stellaceae bacterium]
MAEIDAGTVSVSPFFVLSRLGYGPKEGDVIAFERLGLADWLDQQLKPPQGDDAETAAALSRARLRINYPAGDASKNQGWVATDEMRPLATLDEPIDTLWPLIAERDKYAPQERRRPLLDMISATIIRAVHSRYQLREILCRFWHDHFNVDAWSAEPVAVALPTYDRDVIRPNCFGNFRHMLEAVATSTAMLYYLSNRSSRAGAANENYGRELFELHTLGRDAYLNDKYDRWREVPGALKGHPVGYIDEDVYESARAFTGWTVADGTPIDGGRKLPATGRFAYVESWHDGYQKRVLATDFNEFQPAMADGRRVLDLVAAHPATARFICRKLVQRLVADDPPPRLVAAAVSVWSQNLHAPDQIAKVVRAIVLSSEFAQSDGAKIRRPLALVAAFARATALDITPTEPLINNLAAAGERLYGYPDPTGLPDERDHFIGTGAMRVRWQLAFALTQNQWGTGLWIPDAVMPASVETLGDAAAFWVATLTGQPSPGPVAAILGGIGAAPDDRLGPRFTPDAEKRLGLVAAYAAMSPAFQSC